MRAIANMKGISVRRSRLLAGAAAAVLLGPLLPVVPAATVGVSTTAAPNDFIELPHKDFTLNGQKVATPQHYQPPAQPRLVAAALTPPVGTVRQWLGLDDTNGQLYRKDYTLRGIGEKIEVWVANDTAFPAGDCRARVPGSTTITDTQVAYLIDAFDHNIYPKETTTFSTPPDRDGSNATLGADSNGNGGVYTGDGNKTVTLVDNVRDDNFYNYPAALTYVAGFFQAEFNELFDRNVMTVDAFDWIHRTTANPPDEPASDPCVSRPGRPFGYEGVFAHEWQHLAHYYADPFETPFINEGMADFSAALTGYVDGTRTVFDRGGDSFLYCFQGWGNVQTPYNLRPKDCGGPENSLNLWAETDNPYAIFADYGYAFSFMLFLFDRYGADFISRLHRDGQRQGLTSVKAALEAIGVHDVYRVIHDYQTMAMVDKIIGESPQGVMLGVPKSRVTTPSLRSTINLDNPHTNGIPGAAPNGADFVQLKDANGTVVAGRDLRSLSFEGAKKQPPMPLNWKVVTDPDRPGNPVLRSGTPAILGDAAIGRITVPKTDPTLRFQAKYGAGSGLDFGYVVVSTDGGVTYTALASDRTIPGPYGPGLHGTTNGFQPHTFDLSAYAGKTVLLGFRYVSDANINQGGLLIDDVTVGSTLVSDGASLAPFGSPTEIKPVKVHNWNLRLIGVDRQRSTAMQIEIDGRNSVRLSRYQLLLFSWFPTVIAVVAYDEPDDLVSQYAPYRLSVNGVVQAGGSSLSAVGP
jgi:hypothetical protein